MPDTMLVSHKGTSFSPSSKEGAGFAAPAFFPMRNYESHTECSSGQVPCKTHLRICQSITAGSYMHSTPLPPQLPPLPPPLPPPPQPALP